MMTHERNDALGILAWVAWLASGGLLACGGGFAPGALDDAGEREVDGPAPDGDGLEDAGVDLGVPEGAFIHGCGSLLAVRVGELQSLADPSWPRHCDAPLVADQGEVREGGAALCRAGESPNACQARLYAAPPSLSERAPGCSLDRPAGCLLARYTARCADGTDGCAAPEAICQDGTRPMVYAEPATEGGPSNTWIFWLTAQGGPCVGGNCWFNYRFASLLGDEAAPREMSTSHPDITYPRAELGGGLLSGVGVFGRANRVSFKRCTDLASDAAEAVPASDGVPPELAAAYPTAPIATGTSTTTVHHRGLATARAALRLFATDGGRDLDDDGAPDLPSLADAETVILAASSDASMWLVHAGDRLAEEVRAIAGPDVTVKLLVDGYFEPHLDGEARFHPEAPADFNSVRDTWADTGLCALPDNRDGVANEACSMTPYEDGGRSRRALDARNVYEDDSCAAFHGAGAAACREKQHVLVHHLTTPLLVLADQEDNTISDVPPAYGEVGGYQWPDLAAYRARILALGRDLRDHWHTSAREEGPGAAGGLTLILPKQRREGGPPGAATHVRLGNSGALGQGMTWCSPEGARVRTLSFREAIATWIAGTTLSGGPPGAAEVLMEDAGSRDPARGYAVTGDSCRAPE